MITENAFLDPIFVQVTFGFCISDCGFTGSNTNAAQAVKILTDLKTYNGGEFACNGGGELIRLDYTYFAAC